REREEEILKATWVGGVYKSIWIDQFRKMSKLAYDSADIVTSLYAHAGKLQEQIGCPKNKIVITPNGITVENFENIPLKGEEEKKYIQIGAVLRVAPIKDVKTLIQAFSYAKEKVPALKLFIMGPVDEDPEYVHECYDLVRDLRVKDVVFTGRINTRDYLGRMDFTILTSISEGQPLTILESFAAHKPVIATDVGDCKGLVYGEEGDTFGDAGIITHIMNTQEISDAIVKLAESEKLRTEMGEVGYKRVCEYFRVEYMKDQYKDLYERLRVMKVERSRS
ncbi:MAG: GT4 family glycosyltransferase PelF, partial [Lachnospiraceae bacterium]|nr:GT4 family glycosyltransferase PelF [Lachnospiraceae bacterium]